MLPQNCRRRTARIAICTAAIFLIVGGFAVPRCSAQSYATARLADGFDMPVGKPDAVGYYVYRGFTQNGHLGEDWNGVGGGNTDLGDPVYSIAHGIVVFSEDFRRGWGNVVIVRHAYREQNGQIAFVDSLYGHLQRRAVSVGQQVTRGQLVGTIGRGPYNMYEAHLHFEIRKDLRVGMRRDLYPRTFATYHDPRTFMNARRRLRHEDRLVRVPVNTFLKTNPNRLETEEIELTEPELSETPRPMVPVSVEEIIGEVTEVERTTPEDSKNVFERLFRNLKPPE